MFEEEIHIDHGVVVRDKQRSSTHQILGSAAGSVKQ